MPVIPEPEPQVYSFGELRVWPKPELKTQWDAIRAYADLQNSVAGLSQFARVNGRIDHYVHNLDVLAHALRDALFKVMVIREALTGCKSQEQEESCP